MNHFVKVAESRRRPISKGERPESVQKVITLSPPTREGHFSVPVLTPGDLSPGPPFPWSVDQKPSVVYPRLKVPTTLLTRSYCLNKTLPRKDLVYKTRRGVRLVYSCMTQVPLFLFTDMFTSLFVKCFYIHRI